MNNILLTGSSGFIGKNLIPYLKEYCFHIENLRVRYNDHINLKNPFHTLIHLSGKAHDLKKIVSNEEYYNANYNLTVELYDEFLKSTGKKFIYFSSVKAVTDHSNTFLREDDEPHPKTHYGRSKLMAEKYIQKQPLPEGKSYYILRPCMVHGPANKGNLNLLYQLISKGIPYPLAAFENERSFLSVENLCFVIKELLDRNDIPSGVYNVCDEEALSTNELIKLIAKASDKTPLMWKISPVLIRSLAKLGDILRLPLTTERLNKLTENYLVDNIKLREALGKRLPVQARAGIIKTIRSFQTN